MKCKNCGHGTNRIKATSGGFDTIHRKSRNKGEDGILHCTLCGCKNPQRCKMWNLFGKKKKM